MSGSGFDASFFVFSLELLDSARSIDNFVFTREERMRRTRRLYCDHRILFAVFPLRGFICVHRRAGHKGPAVGGVLNNDVAVVGVDVFLHCRCLHTFSIVTGRKGAAPAENRRWNIVKMRPKGNSKYALSRGVYTEDRVGYHFSWQ